MRPDENQRWLTLADRIGAGDEINWHVEHDSASTDRDRALVRSLHTLSAISQLHTRDRNHDVPDFPSVNPLGDLDRWGDLTISGRLGHGSFGSVYDAFDPQLQREVALKLLHPGKLTTADAKQRMLDEGRSMARVRHENLIQVFGLDEHDDRVGIWMEKIEGETLAARVQRDGPMGEDELYSVAKPLAQALAAIHQAGLYHRDVKAQNVMRASGGRIVLMDFGAASPRLESDDQRVTGTPLYLAPELLKGASASAQSDIYGLGVLLFHLASGSYPVLASDLSELKAAHFSGEVRRLADLRPDLSPELCAIIDRAVRPNPANRYATAGEMISDLASASPVRAVKSSRRRWLWIPAAAAAVVVGLWLWAPQMLGLTPSFSVETALHSWSGDVRRELFAGARVQVGDELTLEMTSDRPLHTYVLTEDDRGNAWVMFPRPEFEIQNPVPAGTHTLPGPDVAWSVDTSGGREHILVLASPEPLASLDEHLESFFADGTPIPPDELTRVRGISSVVQRQPARSEQTSLLGHVESALAEGAQSNGVWMRTFVLNNPE